MKVKCIEKPATYFPITVGTIYDVLEETKDSYRILDDRGDEEPFFKHRFEVVTYELSTKETKPITYKDFLASMPEDSLASVMFGGNGVIYIFVYDLEFDCKTEERAEEVYAALITLFKEDV